MREEVASGAMIATQQPLVEAPLIQAQWSKTALHERVLKTASNHYAGIIVKFQHPWVLQILEVVAIRARKKMSTFDKNCPSLVQYKIQGYGLGCSGVDSQEKALYK